MPSQTRVQTRSPREQAHPLRVVAIGGGTGLSTLLRGFKHFSSPPPTALPPNTTLGFEDRRQRKPNLSRICDLAAIVTVTDDGGSSGRLREDMNILPPGDVRNCMVALSEDETLLAQLFQHRFRSGDLRGHSFGNLFLAALTEMRGDFAQAVHASSQILATRGCIYPATTTNAMLAARMEDGTLVRGETRISASKSRILELMLEPSHCDPLPETLDAIATADLITLGPGSLFTSVITNLLVHGIPQALAATRATRVYVCNLMTQANESLGLTASEHIEKILEHAGEPILDYALINTGQIRQETLSQYAAEGQIPIEADLDRIRALGVIPVTGNFVHEGDVLRHSYDLVAETALDLASSGHPSVLTGAL